MGQEDSVEGNLNYRGPDHEVSEGKNFRKGPLTHSCGILTRNMATFCPCPKILPEDFLKESLIHGSGGGYLKTT